MSMSGAEFAEKAPLGGRSEGYRYVPIIAEISADTETPVTVFAKCASGKGRFLLESVERGALGRYSYIGWEPLAQISADGRKVTVENGRGKRVVEAADPLECLRQLLAELNVAPVPELGAFYGGAVGYVGYDYVRRIEQLPEDKPAVLGLPEVFLIIPKFLIRFDHVTQSIAVIVLADTEDGEGRWKAEDGIKSVLERLQKPLDLAPVKAAETGAREPEYAFGMTAGDFQQKVLRIKEYLAAGDAFQVVLSQRIEAEFGGDPFSFYRVLRRVNPSPYLFYLDFGGFQLVGSSPEILVRCEGDQVTLKPIAGTRPRGRTKQQDQALASEMLNDPKERSEHMMLVDLGRNDLGKVCRFGSVQVQELMAVEHYSHVMHIVSTVVGKLLPEYSTIDLFRAVFPAGTLSGAPKVRAMEIIDELEPVRREFYGGAVGYFGFHGNMDTCITIRTVLFKDGKAVLQVGAGIVAESVPETEYQETVNKAKALLTALRQVTL